MKNWFSKLLAETTPQGRNAFRVIVIVILGALRVRRRHRHRLCGREDRYMADLHTHSSNVGDLHHSHI